MQRGQVQWKSDRQSGALRQSSRHGNFVEAPVGAGIFEIRRISDHVTVALSYTANLAHTLSTFAMRGKKSTFYLHAADQFPSTAGELKYPLFGERSAFRRQKSRWS